VLQGANCRPQIRALAAGQAIKLVAAAPGWEAANDAASRRCGAGKRLRAQGFGDCLRGLFAPAEAPCPAACAIQTGPAPCRCGSCRALAEENKVIKRLARTILERAGHPVDVAGNGRAALDAVRRNVYDVVLMELQMPEMDGIEAVG